MLGTGKSFRTSRDADVVRDGPNSRDLRRSRVSAGSINLACTIAKGHRSTRKTYTVNGRAVRYASFLGKLRVVTFVPADLQLAAGAPSQRRAFLNVALAQDNPAVLSRVSRAIAKRCSRRTRCCAPSDPGDPGVAGDLRTRTLVDAGTHIVLARNHFMSRRSRERSARRAHARFTGGGGIASTSTYEPNVAFEAPTADAVAAALTARLRHVAESERARRSAVAGPHRDDLALALDGHSLAAYGSQGQQRTAVLALKVAEYAVMRERAERSAAAPARRRSLRTGRRARGGVPRRRRRLRAGLRHRDASAGGAAAAARDVRVVSGARIARGMLRLLPRRSAGWAPGQRARAGRRPAAAARRGCGRRSSAKTSRATRIRHGSSRARC